MLNADIISKILKNRLRDINKYKLPCSLVLAADGRSRASGYWSARPPAPSSAAPPGEQCRN